ncbi:MAG: hypothetical protein LLG20_23875 [Acidobacteriales bacterium]|nr:hypothetical protein [Terriglobales bacterium]
MNTETTEARFQDKPASVRDALRQVKLKVLSSVETLVDAARHPQEPNAVTLRDVANQARRTGVAFGRLGNAELRDMNRTIAGLAKTQIAVGKYALRTGGALVAGSVSGVLAGIAERLQPPPAGKSDQSKPPGGD